MNSIKEIENQVFTRNDGYLENKYTGLLYQKISDTEVVPLVSPRNGAYLIPNADGSFRTDYDSTTYLLGRNGRIIPQLDPFSRGEIENIDGKLISKYTGAEFTYDPIREAYIPHYIPDESFEPAHIEGDYLIGDETGRKIPIDSDGTILTSKEQYIRERQRQDAERMKRLEENGEFEKWLSEKTLIKTPEEVERLPLELYLEDIKKHPENVTEKDIEILKMLMENGNLPEEVMKDIERIYGKKDSVNTTIGNFLENISTEQELCDYLISIGFRKEIINQLHQKDKNFFKNIFDTDKEAFLSIQDNGTVISILISTTPTIPQSIELTFHKEGKISITKSIHEPLLVEGIRTGNSHILSARMDNGSLILLESEYQLHLQSKDILSFMAKASRKDSIIRPDGTIQEGNSKEECGICFLSNKEYLEPIHQSITDPTKIDEAYTQMQKLRQLGFHEKFFHKTKIAGLSYDLEGNETYLDSEFETESSEKRNTSSHK